MRMLSSRAAYELWAETYPAVAHNPLMLAEQHVVTRHLSDIRAARALDVGTGSGRCVPLVATTGARTIIGADLSLGMLRRNRCRDRVCADAHHLPFADGAFDLISASLMAGDIPDLVPWIAELARLLAPGGHFIYSDFHPSWTSRGWQRTFHASDGQECALPRAEHQIDDHFAALARAGLTVLAADDVNLTRDRWRVWGPRLHVLPAALVFHARKAAP